MFPVSKLVINISLGKKNRFKFWKLKVVLMEQKV